MDTKRDFLGSVLNIGDEVVFMQIHYRGLMIGRITSMSEKKATLRHDRTNTYKAKSIQFYNQILKIQGTCHVCGTFELAR